MSTAYDLSNLSKGKLETENPDVQLQEQESSPDDQVAHLTKRREELVNANLEKRTSSDGSSQENYDDSTAFSRVVGALQATLSSSYQKNKRILRKALYVILLVGWVGYVAYAMYYNFKNGFDAKKESAVRLLSINVVICFLLCYWAAKKWAGGLIYDACLEPAVKRVTTFNAKHWLILRWVYATILSSSIAVILMVDIWRNRPANLYSGIGIVVFTGLFFVFSSNPAKVRWRPVVAGLLLQFIFAYVILRTCWGFQLFKWLGERMQQFIDHTDEGSKFVFGDLYTNHFFAFKVLPVIIFLSAAINMLYYLGWMQVVIEKIAWVMQVTMGTTAGESLNAAANIFVGPIEAPLVIKPLLRDMTRSELHAVMASGFSTISSNALAAYMLFGIPPVNLLSATVMAAPASLALSKLFYPETEKTKITLKAVENMAGGPEKSLLEALSAGASLAAGLITNIAANLIAFLAVKNFLNESLKWLGAQVGLAPPAYPDFTFEFICSYLLWPFAWVMGADTADCGEVASLIGVKTFTNEFIAYSQLGNLMSNRGKIEAYQQRYPNHTLAVDPVRSCYPMADGQCLKVISERSELIAVYALCSFANMGCIGIVIGGLDALAPERKKDVIALVIRAMIAGSMTCFLTACMAGLVTLPESRATC